MYRLLDDFVLISNRKLFDKFEFLRVLSHEAKQKLAIVDRSLNNVYMVVDSHPELSSVGHVKSALRAFLDVGFFNLNILCHLFPPDRRGLRSRLNYAGESAGDADLGHQHQTHSHPHI